MGVLPTTNTTLCSASEDPSRDGFLVTKIHHILSWPAQCGHKAGTSAGPSELLIPISFWRMRHFFSLSQARVNWMEIQGGVLWFPLTKLSCTVGGGGKRANLAGM